MSEHNQKHIPPSTPDADSSTANVNQSRGVDSKSNGSGPSDNLKATDGPADSKSQLSNAAPADPFDPMNLGISTDYAAAINAQASQAKPTRPKKLCPHTPDPRILRVQQRHLVGQSNREIARAERCGRSTVSKIVKSPKIQEHLQRVRERIWGMADCAADVVYEAIVEKRDVKTSYELLRDIGVLPRKGEPLQLPATTPEDGMSRQAYMAGCALLEGHANLGVDLPKDIEDVLAKESMESAEGAKTSKSKLPRR
jgi:predicted transcriptional regulator